jgi:NAD-dependent SIR2 family protein deacetylase
MNRDAKHLSEDKLAAFNKFMADLRTKALDAPDSQFHQLLGRLFGEGRIVKCLTANFEGLEAQKTEDSSRIISMRGDNLSLRCSTPSCLGIDILSHMSMHRSFQMGESVSCPACTELGE